MASEEAKFAARADRLAGRQGVAGFMPASARAAQPAPTNRYIMPQFVEKTPYGMKTQDAYSRLVRGSHHLPRRAGGRRLRRRRDGPAAGPRNPKIRTVTMMMYINSPAVR